MLSILPSGLRAEVEEIVLTRCGLTLASVPLAFRITCSETTF